MMRDWKILRLLRHTPLHPQWLLGDSDALGQWVGASAHGTVLDIGCADRWIEKFLPSSACYVGMDHWETGRKLYKARPDVFADAAMLPMAAGSCDCIVLLEVLEHLRDPQAALHEIARALRPGGNLFLSVPFLYPVHDAPHDYQRLTPHGLVRDLEGAGLEIIQFETRLHAVESATLLACLAMGGTAMETLRKRNFSLLLLPVLAALLPLVNIAGWTMARLLPDWPALTSGFRVLARRPEPIPPGESDQA